MRLLKLIEMTTPELQALLETSYAALRDLNRRTFEMEITPKDYLRLRESRADLIHFCQSIDDELDRRGA
jgi:hypothetical protein